MGKNKTTKDTVKNWLISGLIKEYFSCSIQIVMQVRSISPETEKCLIEK
jgi:hypothetical protein